MADGYGFGAEGDWKTAALVRLVKVMSAGLPGGTSFMEDYTYHLGAEHPQILGAHMLEVCPSIAAGRPVAARSIRSPSADATIRSGWCSPPRPARASCSGSSTSAPGCAWSRNEVDVVDARARTCRGCRSRVPSGCPGPNLVDRG